MRKRLYKPAGNSVEGEKEIDSEDVAVLADGELACSVVFEVGDVERRGEAKKVLPLGPNRTSSPPYFRSERERSYQFEATTEDNAGIFPSTATYSLDTSSDKRLS